MTHTYTAAEALKVHGRVARTSGREVADRWLQAKGFGGALVTEATLNAAAEQAVARANAARDAKKARKAAQRTALETAIRRQVTETMTAAHAPAPPPGTGLASQDGGVPSAGDLAAMSREQLSAIPLDLGGTSPFWQSPGTAAAAGSAPEPSRPLHEMSGDELQAYAADALGRYGRAAGYGSPVWQ